MFRIHIGGIRIHTNTPMHMNQALKLLLLDESTSVNEKKIEGKNDASKTILNSHNSNFRKITRNWVRFLPCADTNK